MDESKTKVDKETDEIKKDKKSKKEKRRKRSKSRSRSRSRSRSKNKSRSRSRSRDRHKDRHHKKRREDDSYDNRSRGRPSFSHNNKRGGGSIGGASQDVSEKKKLLWGDTKKTSSVWNAAEFEDPARKEKFLKLMGLQKKPKEVYNPFDPTGDSPEREESKKEEKEATSTVVAQAPPSNSILSLERQRKQFQELERQFDDAVVRKESRMYIGRTSGLGLRSTDDD